MIYDCIIIGGGPAGIAASIQLKRTGWNILLLEKSSLGGLLVNAHQVENYLGHLKISGKALARLFQKQVKIWKIPCRREEVKAVIKRGIFEVSTSKNSYHGKTVLIATGTIAKKWPLPIPHILQKKVFTDWSSLESKLQKKPHARIGIIGGGDLAFDFALHMKALGAFPLIFVRNKPTCLALLFKRSIEQGIQIFENTKINNVEEQGKNLLLYSAKQYFETDLILVAIGREPTLPEIHSKKTPGLYFAGDVQNGLHRQAGIAAGDGLKAAMKISHYLQARSANTQRS